MAAFLQIIVFYQSTMSNLRCFCRLAYDILLEYLVIIIQIVTLTVIHLHYCILINWFWNCILLNGNSGGWQSFLNWLLNLMTLNILMNQLWLIVIVKLLASIKVDSHFVILQSALYCMRNHYLILKVYIFATIVLTVCFMGFRLFLKTSFLYLKLRLLLKMIFS